MNKFKPFLITAAVVVVVMALVFRAAPAKLRALVVGG
jgi:hypothetical protein